MTTQVEFLDKIEAAIKALNINEDFTREQFPDDGQFTRMGLVLSWDEEKALPGSNERDDVVYTAVVVLNKGSTRASAAEFPFVDAIRDAVYQRFNNKRIFLDDNTISPLPMMVKFGTNGLPESWQKNRYSGVIQIMGRYRRTRPKYDS